MNDKRFTKYLTPALAAQFIYAQTPNTKFNKDGDYEVTLLLPTGDANGDQLAAQIEKLAAEAHAENLKAEPAAKKFALHTGLTDWEDKEGNKLGRKVKFKAKYKGTKKDGTEYTTVIPVFDASGNPVPADVKIGRDSVVVVSYQALPFCMKATRLSGVSLKLKAMQIVKLNSYGNDADSFGFTKQAGYTAAPQASAPADEEEQEEPAENASGDF